MLHPTQLVQHACYGKEPLSSHTAYHQELDNIRKIFLGNPGVLGRAGPLVVDCVQLSCCNVSKEI